MTEQKTPRTDAAVYCAPKDDVDAWNEILQLARQLETELQAMTARVDTLQKNAELQGQYVAEKCEQLTAALAAIKRLKGE